MPRIRYASRMSSPMGPLNSYAKFCEAIEAIAQNRNILSLSFEPDASALGLNCLSGSQLHEVFSGPWGLSYLQPHNIDWPESPPEYKISESPRQRLPRLPPINVSLYKDDLLFYIFYIFIKDALQLMAANELYNRGWRYHVEWKVWMKQISNIMGQNVVCYFDPTTWKKGVKNPEIDYNKLEGKPRMPE